MREPAKITILLADEDALRRDGLAAVLSGNAAFEIVAGVPDGESAMSEIRELRPDVAVVDLNLPKLHGIELVRRIRSEALGTKVVILAGTDDNEIVREVVRAGGDGYLLKNGPARHLVDAISYVRDGGQYFSPQLRRDGRDRHLLEEPPRPLMVAPVPPGDDEAYQAERASRDSRPGKTRNAHRSSDPAQLRRRIREETPESDLNDHDYEVMSMMADGIRPILDRLDEIDNRVAQMEEGEAPVPADPRGWLSTQLADTLREQKGGDLVVGRSVQDLETRLPELIDEAVTRRFHQMANKLQEEIEETHVRTLETFVKNIQVKLVQRVSALETDMARQAEAMHQLRDYSQRTEDNLSRLISGVDKLAQELPKRLAAPLPEAVVAEPVVSAPKPLKRRSPGGNRAVKRFWAVVGGVLLIALLVWAAAAIAGRSKTQEPVAGAAGTSGSAGPAPIPGGTDTKTRMQAAQEYVERKDYAMAEDIYKQVVKVEPNNVEALTALAGVLYNEDKIDESAAIMDRIPKR